MRKDAERPLACLMIILAVTIWGGSYPVTKYALAFLPPFFLAFLRYALAACIFAPLLRKRLRIDRADVPLILLCGLTGSLFFVSFMNIGMGLTTGVSGSLLSGTPPLITALLAFYLLGEPLRPRKGAGLVIGFGGVLCVAGAPYFHSLGSASMMKGNIIILAAQVSWALYTTLARKAARRYPGEVVAAWTMIVGASCLCPLALAESLRRPGYNFSGGCVLAILYLVLLNTALAYYFWNRALRVVRASTAASFQYLQPVSGALISISFLGEGFHLSLVAGAVLIVGGLFLVLRQGRGFFRLSPAEIADD